MSKDKWTIMFYFASDSPLAPGIVSHLKALKNAGYHPNVNVIAYFDPQTPGTPSHIFDVNGIEKIKNPGGSKIGFGNDPWVPNLMLDKLWSDEKGRDGTTTIRELIEKSVLRKHAYTLPNPPPFLQPNGGLRANKKGKDSVKYTEPGPQKCLEGFLDFCAKEYEANHYMLFILGHGLIVGNDIFLYDEHASVHSLTLKDLGQTLKTFKEINTGEFELVSFHSCSMSSIEVAYQLQDTAKYMLASQGPAFVGSWPYTQILIRIFNDLQQHKKIDIEEMLKKIFDYVLHNSTDFMLAGYSFDLCLCDLTKIGNVKEGVMELAGALRKGLIDPVLENCILLAHWRAQSYWNEYYTDLYDFCYCLSKYCNECPEPTKNSESFKSIETAVVKVMEVLKKSDQVSNNPIVCSEFAGPASQYSHGLSVFFPWAEPSQDRLILDDYQSYKFNKDTKWFDFLRQYWQLDDGTQRASRKTEKDERAPFPTSTDYKELMEDMASLMFNPRGPLKKGNALANASRLDKIIVRDPAGDECSCGSIKNYPHDTRKIRERIRKAFGDVPMSSFFLNESR